MLTFAFMLSSLPCLYTFWHAIPTSFYILMFFISLVNKLALARISILQNLFSELQHNRQPLLQVFVFRYIYYMYLKYIQDLKNVDCKKEGYPMIKCLL